MNEEKKKVQVGAGKPKLKESGKKVVPTTA